MRNFPCVLGFFLAFCGSRAAPPPSVQQDLTNLGLVETVTDVARLPRNVRAALARTFHQKSLRLGNPSDRISGAVTYPGDPDANAPYRRLIFAFRTHGFFYVYYEKGDPELSAACLAFPGLSLNSVKLIWGGADLNRGFAKNPQQLATRVLAGKKIFDDRAYYW